MVSLVFSFTPSAIQFKSYSRNHRVFISKSLGLSGRTSRVHNVLILLIESGTVYFIFQASEIQSSFIHSSSLLAVPRTQAGFLGLNLCQHHEMFSVYIFGSIYLALSVSSLFNDSSITMREWHSVGDVSNDYYRPCWKSAIDGGCVWPLHPMLREFLLFPDKRRPHRGIRTPDPCFLFQHRW